MESFIEVLGGGESEIYPQFLIVYAVQLYAVSQITMLFSSIHIAGVWKACCQFKRIAVW
jgi:hypothetical protein